MRLHGKADIPCDLQEPIELRLHTFFSSQSAHCLNRETAAWSRSRNRFFNDLANQQLGPLRELEHFEADHADRNSEATEELVHALQSGVNAGADEQHGDFARVSFAV